MLHQGGVPQVPVLWVADQQGLLEEPVGRRRLDRYLRMFRYKCECMRR